MIKDILDAYEKKDLTRLKSLVKPSKRKQNTTLEFRSVLMLSAHNIKHLQKIPDLSADAVMLNLEDGVAKEQKPFALLLCAYFLSKYQKIDKKLIVRVNALDEGGLDEIKYLNHFMPDAIRVPKICSKDDVEMVLDVLDDSIELHLSIETKEAWLNLKELSYGGRVKAFYLGILDLFADMKISQGLINIDNMLIKHILCEFFLTSKVLGVKPVSFVFQEFRDIESFKEWLKIEKEIGYNAKGCISPKQSEIVNSFFTPSDEELQRAKKIVELFETNQKNSISGFTDEKYGFIDEPIYKGALAILGYH